jgi:cyclopropane fatty-acyl-phospholipid synthase-like methyltransferase
MELSDIMRYYEQTQILYSYLWNRHNLHNGIFDENTSTLKQAIENSNDIVMRTLDVKDGDKVLDAGCGVGGAVFHIAERNDVDITGITISDTQLKIALREARKRGMDKANFRLENYLHTSFENDSFDKVYGIESICYAPDKGDFCKEAYRVLKTRGRVAILDAYLIRPELNAEQQKAYDIFREGMIVPNLADLNGMRKNLEDAGFSDVDFISYKDRAQRSFEHTAFMGRLFHPLFNVLDRMKILPDTWFPSSKSCIAIKELVDNGAWEYGIFTGDKRV